MRFYVWMDIVCKLTIEHFCFVSGTADFLQNPCPVGHYCNSGIIQAEACPPGTYKNVTGAKSVNDCDACPAGNYCPRNRSGLHIKCDNGTYCPNGSIKTELCEAGFFCPYAEVKIPCPSGFYCPTGSANRIPCPTGHYCTGHQNCSLAPGGSVFPIICPLGN